MQTIRFAPMPSTLAEAYRGGAPDAYGCVPERHTSPGGSYQCRHCLAAIAEGEPYLTLAYRPFPHLQPYAETGPIFLHAEECASYNEGDTLPPIFESPDYIVRGYGHDDRIVYGTGAVTETSRIAARAQELLQDEKIAYVHVRSARNNCFQCRIERTPAGEDLPEGLETA
ncbi:DUF1203 domain-containing protein [Agrobacterium vitis]|uniref:DUF1203 domain-containing protein n=1 Tax=Agrobacterium vitis TaxID=373 RepID=UPI000872C4C1|nr:DUF1203 domain-containing protein [Agrobacterium vitis]MCE6073478.1 DUF1203 domain-containing protein [Agrobacterium vitis]MCM2452573.1 DUF1203 domain-containing protein [Agrobacterium vitis]MCM2469409.1 DUF1203 domain-containing protein [Agrobacterium vitis]MUO69118.1 DUF1203 domain-containing protein [Agrobacterium vitis]MUO83668.1 DUF1203 domain-containing protein [Agrobacterium vitis]